MRQGRKPAKSFRFAKGKMNKVLRSAVCVSVCVCVCLSVSGAETFINYKRYT